MITSKLMVCCQGAVRDAQTNNISIFNIVEQLSAVGFPLFIQKLYLVAYLQREPGDEPNSVATLEIQIGEEMLHTQPIDLAFGDKLRTRLLTEMQGMAIPQPGDLRFTLKVGEAVLNSWQIRVETQSKPQLELKEI